MASPKSIQYARDLIEECGYDEEDYDLDNMGQREISELIDQLKEELGHDEQWGGYESRRSRG